MGIHNGHDDDPVHALKGEYSKLRSTETVYPGQLGGVIAPMASDGATVFVPVVNLPVSYSEQAVQKEGPNASGELVALDTATGAVRWKHSFSAPAFAAATVVNDLVFTTTFDGTLHALDARSGEEVWTLKLPAGTNTGVAVARETLVAAAGVVQAEGQTAEMVAYRVGANPGTKSE